MKYSNSIYNFRYSILLLLSFTVFNLCKAQTYCTPYSHYGCGLGYDYGTLERMQIKDAAGNTIYDKAADGCNTASTSVNTAGNGFTLISSSSQFVLYGGSQYSLGISVSATSGKSIYSFNINVAAWIDYDRDGNFTSSEYISTGWTNPVSDNGSGVGGKIQANIFKIPCGFKAGVTRMRVITYLGSPLGSSLSCPKGSSSSPSLYYGEQEDYTITLSAPSGLSTGFSMASSAFVGSPVKLTNKNQTGYLSYQWDIGANGSIEYTTTNASHIFTDTGKKCIRLNSNVCGVRDSTLKCLQIVSPTAKPVADFISDQNKIERFGTVNFMDMSTNGPTSWKWFMYDPIDSVGTRQDVESYNSNLVGNNPYVNANPNVFFNRTGTYTVCLTTSNSLGSFIRCKNNYVQVTKTYNNNMGVGTIQPIYEQVGDISDDGGPANNYTDNSPGFKYATIIPCGAKKITLTFSQFKLASGDYLKIYDGTNANGKPLHSGSGFTNGKVPTSALIAYSGAIYLYFSTNGSGNDEGFIASWKTEGGANNQPIADFLIPDTLYNPLKYKFVNTSLSVFGKTDYVWEINPGYGEVAYTKDMEFAFTKDGTYTVTLDATTCKARNTFSKSVVIKTPHKKVDIGMEASNQRPTMVDTVSFKVINPIKGKALQADKFLWSFSPNTVTFVRGTSNSNAEPQVVFNAKGKYTVSLCAWNSLDSSATVNCLSKKDFVMIIEYCEPTVGTYSSADVAINTVTLSNKFNITLLENNSGKNTNGYDDYSSILSATIYHGGTYHLELSRYTTANNMTRKVWIDFNIDGDFDDAGELVASEGAVNTSLFQADFTVPDCSKAVNGKTKMRIGVSYSSDPNVPCGASSGITNANRIGEFEDYTMIIGDDGYPPVLTINGNDTVFIEKGSSYIEYGATAMDTTEGNISSKVTITSNVDPSYVGIYRVEYNVTDASCQQAIPVFRLVHVMNDLTKPQLTLNGADTVFIEVISESYKEEGATASDNKDGNITNSITIKGSVNSNITGIYILTYSVKDMAGNSASKQRVIIVRDTKKPVISNHLADTGNMIKIQVLSIFTDSTKVTDNYDTPKLIAKGNVNTSIPGIYAVTYDATDNSGNKADTRIFKYKVDDYIAPLIFLHSADTLEWPVNKAYVSVLPTVYDNYYDISKIKLTNQHNVNPYKLGLYYDDYTARDSSGNVGFKRCWVRVVDKEAPVIHGGALTVGLNSNVDTFSGITVTDNYDGPAQLKSRIKVVSGNIDVTKEGIYSIYLQVADLSGNISQLFERVIWVKNSSGIAKSDMKNQMEVYPNPSSGVIYITSVNEDAVINVYNALGSPVDSFREVKGRNGVASIDLSSLPGGIYFLNITSADRNVFKKIVIER